MLTLLHHLPPAAAADDAADDDDATVGATVGAAALVGTTVGAVVGAVAGAVVGAAAVVGAGALVGCAGAAVGGAAVGAGVGAGAQAVTNTARARTNTMSFRYFIFNSPPLGKLTFAVEELRNVRLQSPPLEKCELGLRFVDHARSTGAKQKPFYLTASSTGQKGLPSSSIGIHLISHDFNS
jgi:hypothetical protein